MKYYDLYAQQMAPLGHGLAVWEPEPDSMYDKIEIADVGYMQDGCFFRLFNAGLPIGHPKNNLGVPNAYEPLQENDLGTRKRSLPARRPLWGSDVKVIGANIDISPQLPFLEACAGLQVNVKTSSGKGAMLLTGREMRAQDAYKRLRFEKYILKHHDSWLDFANHRHGRGVRLEDLILISGYHVTNEFAMLAFSEGSVEAENDLKIGFPNVASGSLSVSTSSRHTVSPAVNFGPQSKMPWSPSGNPSIEIGSKSTMGAADEFTQCVFLRGYRVKKWAGIVPKVIKAGAGPHDLGSEERPQRDYESLHIQESSKPSSDSDDLEIISDTTPTIDPTHPLLQHILQNSEASLAIVHDDDLSKLYNNLSTNMWDHLLDLIKIAPRIEVEDGVGRLRPETWIKEEEEENLTGKETGKFPSVTSADLNIGASPSKPTVDTATELYPSHLERTAEVGDPAELPPAFKSKFLWSPPSDNITIDGDRLAYVLPSDDPTSTQNSLHCFEDPPIAQTFMPHINLNNLPLPQPPSLDAFRSKHFPYDDDDEDRMRKGKGKGRPGGARAAGTCDLCKQSKVKCVFPVPGQPCRRCAHGGHECRTSGRNKGRLLRTLSLLSLSKPNPRAPRSHDELVARLREKDRAIYCLLLPQRPHPTNDDDDAVLPAGLALPDRASQSQSSQSDDPQFDFPVLPVWDKRTPKHEVERRVHAWIDEARVRMMRWTGKGGLPHLAAHDPAAMPEILTSGVVSLQEVDQLFNLFYDKINISFTICDPVLHTPSRVLYSSPFLYTTICAVASRHYHRPRLYHRLIHSARQAAAAALNGTKSIETCQAYLLLGVFHPPPRTFIEDRTFLYLGLAIRMATDLELHLPLSHTRTPSARTPTNELEHRELLHRDRVWLNCFCLDRSVSTQLGKPSAISQKAFPFHMRTWWHGSQYNSPHDIHMCAYAELLSVVSGFHDVVCADARETGVSGKILDLELVQGYADKINAVGEEWALRLAENSKRRPHPVTNWRDNLWPFLVSYAKLVVFSTGLQDGMRQGLRENNPFSDQCIDAASEVLTRVTERLAKLGYLRYCVEAYFLFMGFAAAFLLKILRPKFAFMMRADREQSIIQLVQRLIALLGSDEVAIDERHTPRLYSRLLGDVLARHIKAKEKNAMMDIAPTPAAPAPAGPEYTHTQPTSGGGFGFSTTALPDSQTRMYDLFNSKPAPAYMDVEAAHPAQPANDMMLASMTAITDPQFWEQATMPGFSWTTQPWQYSQTDGVGEYEAGGEGVYRGVDVGVGVGPHFTGQL